MVKKARRLAAILPVAAMTAVAVGAGGAGASTAPSTHHQARTVASTSTDPWGWPGNPTKGYLPPKEPKVHGSGKVTIGLITAGTIHDHGYYESEVTAIDEYAGKHHWTTIIEGSVKTADALSAAENMCSQGVSLLVIGESQLAAAAPAASTSSCKDTPVWIFTSPDVPLTTAAKPYLHIATTTGSPSTFATGVAMGLWLKAHHESTAGFITGPALSFTEGAAQGYLAGIHYVDKSAKMDAVYTGTLTASGPAVTAATAMIAKGVKLIFPYLGASLLPTAKYISSHGGATPSDGGAWCSHAGAKFAIEQSYNPGYLLGPALTEFAHGKMRVGVVQTFALGKTSVPSVSFCSSAGVSAKQKATLHSVIKKLEAGKITVTGLIKKTPIPK